MTKSFLVFSGFWFGCLILGCLDHARAQVEIKTDNGIQKHADWSGYTVRQSKDWLRITPNAELPQNECSIPRLFNPLRRALIHVGDELFPVQVSPEIESWTLRWKDVKHSKEVPLVIELQIEGAFRDAQEVLKSETDGSYWMPAHSAVTKSLEPESMKLRYEPQPFKNTVGYWVSPADYVFWNISVTEPGEFNVEILQGCGAGQGGSQMQVSFESQSGKLNSSIDFVVEETGHFQNFRWRHLGSVELTQADEYQVAVKVRELAHQAAVDIRAMQLIRLPSKTR